MKTKARAFKLCLPTEGCRHMPNGIFKWLITSGALALTIYLLWYALYGTAEPHFQISLFLTIVLPTTFLTTTAGDSRKNLSAFDVFLAACSLAVGLFYVINNEVYVNWFEGISTVGPGDKIAGLALIALTFEACRRALGLGLTSVLLAFLLYTAFGQYIPGGLQHEKIGLDYFLNMQTITTNGVFGSSTQIVASYAFMFLLFGTFYHKAGGGRLFFDVAAALTKGMVGGPSKACVVSSGLYGSISGSPVADVATTGPITIRIMKDAGVSNTRAAAIEAASSAGGAVLPPIMGSVVFIMADFTGIPYPKIAKAAFIAGLIYYFGIMFLVHLYSKRHGEGSIAPELIVGLRKAIARNWHQVIPIVILVYMVIHEYTLSYVATISIAATIAVSWFTKENRIGVRAFVEACTETVFGLAPLAMAVVASGVIIGCIELTGLSGKFSLLFSMFAGGALVPSLIFAMIVLVLLGMGMPTPAVYLMGAALIAPPLIQQFGLPVLTVHMFMVYFASMSAITPPVAVACFAAGAIADARPMAVGFQACKLAIAGFILPFFFIFNPALLLQGTLTQICLATVLALIVVAAVSVAVSGCAGKADVPWWTRAILLIAACATGYSEWAWQYQAAVLCFVCLLATFWSSRSKVPAESVAATSRPL